MTMIVDATPAPHGLAGKVVIVTGGGRGLGRAISEGFAATGAHVAIIGRTLATLDETVSAIAAKGGSAQAFEGDVSRADSIAALCDAVLAAYGHVDVLINNAGINPWYKPAERTELSEWQRIIDVNLTGVFLMSQTVGRVMIAAGTGAIVNITSVAGRVGLARSTAYCAAKGGVEMMTRQLAVEWAEKGVRVNAVAPGYFATDLTAGLQAHPALGATMVARTPLGRFGRPEEVVGACLFLASPAASYVTGHSLAVDGGWTAC